MAGGSERGFGHPEADGNVAAKPSSAQDAHGHGRRERWSRATDRNGHALELFLLRFKAVKGARLLLSVAVGYPLRLQLSRNTSLTRCAAPGQLC